MAEKAAQFRFTGYKILKSSVHIEDKAELNQKLEIKFTDKGSVNEDLLEFKLQLDTKINNQDDSIQIEVSTIGYFTFDKLLTESERKSFFSINGPAILFPYIRAYIGTLSSLSGIKPIILPTLNLSK